VISAARKNITWGVIMIKRIVKKIFDAAGFEIHRKQKSADYPAYPVELTKNERNLIDYVVQNNLTMVSRERLFATLMSCKYVLENNIEGDFVECGVWRGGNSIIAAGMFKLYNSNKKVWLYDTFQGMTTPTEADIELSTGRTAAESFQKYGKVTDDNIVGGGGAVCGVMRPLTM
jgi:hypothetical protein